MSPAPGWIHLVLDVPRPAWAESVAFWSAATRWQPSPPSGGPDRRVTLVPERGDSWLRLQAVEDAPGIHLHLDSTDPVAATERATALGARPALTYGGVAVMRSPGGLPFCHTITDTPRRFARGAADAVLDQVCLDVPAPLWRREVDFWQAMTGRELELGLRPEFAFLGDPDPHASLRILLQRLDETEGPVRAHPDFAVAHRPDQTARHLALGARVVRALDRWTVMRAPDRHVYCLTDRDPSTGRVRR